MALATSSVPCLYGSRHAFARVPAAGRTPDGAYDHKSTVPSMVSRRPGRMFPELERSPLPGPVCHALWVTRTGRSQPWSRRAGYRVSVEAGGVGPDEAGHEDLESVAVGRHASAAGSPPRKTTLPGAQSRWLTSSVRSVMRPVLAGVPPHTAPGGGTHPADASCSARINRARATSTSSPHLRACVPRAPVALQRPAPRSVIRGRSVGPAPQPVRRMSPRRGSHRGWRYTAAGRCWPPWRRS